MKKLSPLPMFAVAGVFFTLLQPAFAEDKPAVFQVRESTAYTQFKTRPVSELSKLIYLIDRFGDQQVEILYDGNYYNAQFASRIARWFLARRYKKETAEAWILRWCNKTLLGNLIWVKWPDGRFLLAREVLMDELRVLNALIADEQARVQAEAVKKNSEAVANIVDSQASAESMTAPSQELQTAKAQTQPIVAKI